jgi:hypothetical protein
MFFVDCEGGRFAPGFLFPLDRFLAIALNKKHPHPAAYKPNRHSKRCFLFKHNTTANNMCYSTSMCGNMDLMVVNAMPNENKQTYTHPIKPAHQQIKSTSMQHIRALVAPS